MVTRVEPQYQYFKDTIGPGEDVVRPKKDPVDHNTADVL